jgi:hypothetical protein
MFERSGAGEAIALNSKRSKTDRAAAAVGRVRAPLPRNEADVRRKKDKKDGYDKTSHTECNKHPPVGIRFIVTMCAC